MATEVKKKLARQMQANVKHASLHIWQYLVKRSKLACNVQCSQTHGEHTPWSYNHTYMKLLNLTKRTQQLSVMFTKITTVPKPVIPGDGEPPPAAAAAVLQGLPAPALRASALLLSGNYGHAMTDALLQKI